jgi:hypothetical protein
MPSERRRGEKLVGVASIVAGLAVVVALLVGADLGSLALVLVSGAVAAWAIYLVAFRKPLRWTIRR